MYITLQDFNVHGANTTHGTHKQLRYFASTVQYSTSSRGSRAPEAHTWQPSHRVDSAGSEPNKTEGGIDGS
jgi:hypothetical protein